VRIILVGYWDLTGPGVIHAYHFAWHLKRLGHDVMLLIRGMANTAELMAEPAEFPILEIGFAGGVLRGSVLRKCLRFKPDLVHVWTPRDVPARVALEICYYSKAKLVVHYEDDEDAIYAANQGAVDESLSSLGDVLLLPGSWNWINPLTAGLLRRYADAFTAIIPTYLDKLADLGERPMHILYPGVDLDRFRPSASGKPVRSELEIAEAKLLVYGGTIGKTHRWQILFEAFAELAQRHQDLHLMVVGRLLPDQEIRGLLEKQGLLERFHLVELASHADMHHYLGAGDVLVQFGPSDDFNRYRLPAKIPEYLAMGKPVVTFDVGIGEQFSDGEDVLLTRTDAPSEFAAQIERILGDDALAARLGENARRRAEELFSWDKNTRGLAAFYEQVLAIPTKEQPAKTEEEPEKYPLEEQFHIDQFLARVRHKIRVHGFMEFLKASLRTLISRE